VGEEEGARLQSGREEVKDPGPADSMDVHEDYVRSLNREEAQLLALRTYLYEGSWDDMVSDLVARREGRPFVFKLQTRIEEDLQRIEKLRKYEEENGVDLGRYARRAPEEAPPAQSGLDRPMRGSQRGGERHIPGGSASRPRLGRGR